MHVKGLYSAHYCEIRKNLKMKGNAGAKYLLP